MQLKKVKVMVLVILGIFVSASVLASEAEEMRLASIDNRLLTATEKLDEDPDEEIGSTELPLFEDRLGGFSRVDGSMAGAYGDGEFGE